MDEYEVQRRAINNLLHTGTSFSVRLAHFDVKDEPKWRRILGNGRKRWTDNRIPKGWSIGISTDSITGERYYVRNFTLKPLYLGTIDMVRSLYIPIESKIKRADINGDGEYEQNLQFIRTISDIVAVSVLNKATAINKYDKERRNLVKFFMENLTIFELVELVEVIVQMMNPSGFTYAIGLLKNLDATSPIAKEKQKG